MGKDQRGGFGQFELGVGFPGCEFEVVFDLGAECVGVKAFGDIVRDVHWRGRPGMARWFVGDQHSVQTAGSEEVGVYFVEEVVSSVGGG